MDKPLHFKPLEVVHVDEELVVVDKPAGVLSAAGRGGIPTAIELLRGMPEFADNEPLRVVHRLDRWASGILVYARTLDAQRHLITQFMNRQVEKVYYALVSGYVPGDGEIDLPLHFDRRNSRMVASPRRGKASLTRYAVVQRVVGNTWLECRPTTGRMHQIRAHLAAIGYPLSVDSLYGGAPTLLLSHYKPNYKINRRGHERPLVDRLTLHAARIAFEHPAGGQRVVYEAPLPKDLRATLSQLGRLV